MKNFFKLLLSGILMIVLSVITVGCTLGAIETLITAMNAVGIGAIVCFIFFLLMVVLVICFLIMGPCIMSIVSDKIMDSWDTKSKTTTTKEDDTK